MTSSLDGNPDQAKHQMNLLYLLGAGLQSNGIADDIHLARWGGASRPLKLTLAPQAFPSVNLNADAARWFHLAGFVTRSK